MSVKIITNRQEDVPVKTLLSVNITRGHH